MSFATFSGPVRIGTVRNTTGTTAGTIRNTGVVPCVQYKNIAYGDTTAQTTLAVIPAGSFIQNIQLIFTTAYTTTNPTFTFFVNGTAITSAVAVTSPAAGATGVASVALGTSNPSLVANVGSTDAVISFTQSNGGGGTGAITAAIAYVTRNPDGSVAPTSFTGP